MSLLNDALKNLDRSQHNSTSIAQQRRLDLSWLSDYHLVKITLIISLLCTLAYNITAQLKPKYVVTASQTKSVLEAKKTTILAPKLRPKTTATQIDRSAKQQSKVEKGSALPLITHKPQMRLPANPRLAQLQSIAVENNLLTIGLSWLPQYKLEQLSSDTWQLILQDTATVLLPSQSPLAITLQNNRLFVRLPKAKRYTITSHLSHNNLAILSLRPPFTELPLATNPVIATTRQAAKNSNQVLLEYLNNGRYQQAIDYFSRQTDQSNTRNRHLAARAYYQLAQHQKVVDTLNTTNLSMEENPHYFALKSLSLVELEQFPAAKTILQQVLKLTPNNNQYWIAFGLSLDGLGKRQGAIDAFLTALADKQLAPPLQDFVRQTLLTWGVQV